MSKYNKYEDTEKEIEKKYAERDKKKAPKMHMSGRSVIQLKKIISKKYDRIPIRKNP